MLEGSSSSDDAAAEAAAAAAPPAAAACASRRRRCWRRVLWTAPINYGDGATSQAATPTSTPVRGRGGVCIIGVICDVGVCAVQRSSAALRGGAGCGGWNREHAALCARARAPRAPPAGPRNTGLPSRRICTFSYSTSLRRVGLRGNALPCAAGLDSQPRESPPATAQKTHPSQRRARRGAHLLQPAVINDGLVV